MVTSEPNRDFVVTHITLPSTDHKAPTMSFANCYNAIENRNQRDKGTPTHSLDALFHEIFSSADVVAGDMNKHHPLWNPTKPMSIWAQNIVDVSRASDFRLANSRGTNTCIPTNNNTPSVIDLIFYKNATTALTNRTALPDHRTLDHIPITFSLSPTEGTSSRYQGFNWNKTEWHLVNNFLPLQAKVESEEDFNHLFHITLRAIKCCTPQRTITKWTRPWWNPDLAESRKVKYSIMRDRCLVKCNKNTANAARNAYLRAI